MRRIILILLCCIAPLALMAQNTRSARGVVFDEKGTPMEGAKLVAVGTTNSVVTGVDGTFEIAVATYTKFIEVSKEGYHSMQLEIDGSYLIARLQVDKKYADNKAKAEEEARKVGFSLRYLLDAYKHLNMDNYFFRPFFELLVGQDYVRKMINQGKSEEDIRACWQEDVAKFQEQRRPYLLYEE